jgi:hypothetical protein
VRVNEAVLPEQIAEPAVTLAVGSGLTVKVPIVLEVPLYVPPLNQPII